MIGLDVGCQAGRLSGSSRSALKVEGGFGNFYCNIFGLFLCSFYFWFADFVMLLVERAF